MASPRTYTAKWTGPGAGGRRIVVLAIVAALGLLAGFLPAGLPVKMLFAGIGGLALFLVIYNNLQVGIVLFFVFNLTIPQAGPTADIGMQVAMVGESRGLHFNLHEIVMAMVLVAWLTQVFLRKAEQPSVGSPLVVPVLLYVVTSVLASFVGLIHGGDELVMAFRFVRTVPFVYIFFVLLNTLKTRKQLRQIVIVLLVCTTVVAMFGLVQKVLGQDWSKRVADKYLAKLGYPAEVNYVAGGEGETKSYRINSSFLHPNILGALLMMALPFFVSLLWYYREPWQRALLVSGILINLACLFYTGSRAAWMAGGVIAVFYGIFGFRDRRMVLTLATVLLVVALVFAIIKPPDFVKKRFVSLSAREATTIRINQYQMAVDFFMEFPIFGLGAGMEGQKIVMYNNIRSRWAAVENAFLTYLVSHGLLGLSVFLLLFVVFLAMMLFTRNNSAGDPFLHYYAEALFLAIIAVIVASQFGAWLIFAIPMWTLFWGFLGVGACLYNMYREQSPASPYARKAPAFGAGPAGGYGKA